MVSVERKVNCEGMAVYRGYLLLSSGRHHNRSVDVQALACEICIIDSGKTIAQLPIADAIGSRVFNLSHRSAVISESAGSIAARHESDRE